MTGVWDKNKINKWKKIHTAFEEIMAENSPILAKQNKNKTVNVQIQETQQAPSGMNLKKYLCPETS